MTMKNEYEKVLYPFQDEVLKVVRDLETNFYLACSTSLGMGVLGILPALCVTHKDTVR